MKKVIIFCFCSFCFLDCTNKQKAQNLKIQEAVNAVENKKRPFDPNINSDTTRKKLFLTFNFENGQIIPTPSKIEIVGGGMPHQPLSSGFKITFKDASMKEIGTYFMENPMILRVYQEPNKPHSSNRITKGQFFVQVPYTDAITFLNIEDTDNKETKPVEINILQILKRIGK
jgi:hypothetical protein